MIVQPATCFGAHDPRPHFGLRSAATLVEIEVRWPDGTRITLRGVQDRRVRVQTCGS